MKYLIAFIVSFLLVFALELTSLHPFLVGWFSCVGWYSTIIIYKEIKKTDEIKLFKGNEEDMFNKWIGDNKFYENDGYYQKKHKGIKFKRGQLIDMYNQYLLLRKET